MGDTVIKVEDLSKRYRIGLTATRHDTLFETLRGVVTRPVQNFKRLRELTRFADEENRSDVLWALEDVSFEVQRGDVVGIVGANGAGKSTLLKVLSRITAPTRGRVTLRGRFASLLEVGTGFHAELSGRENVYLNGTLLGMSKREVDRKFDEIVAFSGVEKFIDTPVKRYSSGMSVRLAFSVAAHLEAEILLIDEVLAVGDVEFQKRCLGKMDSVARGGRTILFVSHNLSAINRLCTRGLVLASGHCTTWDTPAAAIDHYLNRSLGARESCVDLRQASGWEEPRRVILNSISTHRSDGSPTTELTTGDSLVVRIGYELDEPLVGYCQINIVNVLGERIMSLRSTHNGTSLELRRGRGTLECEIPDLRLSSGEYVLMLDIGRLEPDIRWLDCVPEATRIHVSLGDYLGGAELREGQGMIAQKSLWKPL